MRVLFVIPFCNWCWSQAGRPDMEEVDAFGLPAHSFPALYHRLPIPNGDGYEVDACEKHYAERYAPYRREMERLHEDGLTVAFRPRPDAVPGDPPPLVIPAPTDALNALSAGELVVPEVPPPPPDPDQPITLDSINLTRTKSEQLRPTAKGYCVSCDRFFEKAGTLVHHLKTAHHLDKIATAYGQICPLCKERGPIRHGQDVHGIKGGISMLYWLAVQAGDPHGMVAELKPRFQPQEQEQDALIDA